MSEFLSKNDKGESMTGSKADYVCVAHRGRAYRNEPQRLEQSSVQGKTNCLTTVAKDNLIMQYPRGNNHGGAFAEKSPTITGSSWQHNNFIVGTYRTYNVDGGFRPMKENTKSPCLQARARQDGSGQVVVDNGVRIRRLTPTECARLQTIPDWYKWGVSETQQYKLLGNGWTVEVIKHILSYLPDDIKFK